MSFKRHIMLTTGLALGLAVGLAGPLFAHPLTDQISLSLNMRFAQDINTSRSTAGDSLLWYDGFVIDDDPARDCGDLNLTASDFKLDSTGSPPSDYFNPTDYPIEKTVQWESSNKSTGRFSPALVLNVPEPTTVALAGVCGVALLAGRRHKLAGH